jgi:hypothetical protein
MQNTTRKLTAEDERILGKLLVETLVGEITEETWGALSKLNNVPEPYGHLVRYAMDWTAKASPMICKKSCVGYVSNCSTLTIRQNKPTIQRTDVA